MILSQRRRAEPLPRPWISRVGSGEPGPEFGACGAGSAGSTSRSPTGLRLPDVGWTRAARTTARVGRSLARIGAVIERKRRDPRQGARTRASPRPEPRELWPLAPEVRRVAHQDPGEAGPRSGRASRTSGSTWGSWTSAHCRPKRKPSHCPSRNHHRRFPHQDLNRNRPRRLLRAFAGNTSR